jgi:uncharacterized protein (TIGR00297 family)
MSGQQFDERGRKIVHIAFGVGAFTLPYLNWWQAALIAAAALAFNVLALPRFGAHLYRPGERHRRSRSGIVLYPLAVLVLVLAFPSRPDIAASAWAILAVGDGMASMVGRSVGGRAIPWHAKKTWAGSVALFLCGGLAGALAAWWCRPAVSGTPDLWFSLAAPFAAALVAALVETIPIELDDNLSVAFSAAGTLWALSFVRADLVLPAIAAAGEALVNATVVNAGVAWLGHRAGTVTAPGAIAGAAIGIAVAVTTGWGGWALLVATFLAAAASSRIGLRRKARLGIAEERGGRRGAGNAIANTGLAASAALLSVVTLPREPALLVFVTALAAGGSDTMASEIGKAWGRRTFLMPTFSPVAPGTTGAVSLEGTIAGIAGAALLAGIAIPAGLLPSSAILAVVGGATIGSFAESLLGATLEGPAILNNDVLNFLNTSIAAASAIVLAGLAP